MAKKSFYSQTPVVPRKAMASEAAIKGPSIGNEVSRITPQKFGGIHGLRQSGQKFKTPSIRGAVKYGQVGKLSGKPKGHRLGLPK